MTLKERIIKLETMLKPRQLPAIIESFFKISPGPERKKIPAALPADDPRLSLGVDEKGRGVISRWWWVNFWEGTVEEQNARLEQLRLDPKFQASFDPNDGIPIHFEGGATWDEALIRAHERRMREKAALKQP